MFIASGQVYTGNTEDEDNLLGTFSGTSLPAAVETPSFIDSVDSSHEMLVVFSTSSSTTDTGFEAEYQQAERSCSGSTTLGSTNGVISDGSIASYAYTRGNACTWIISPAGSGQGVRLEFSRFSVRGPGDKVQFYSSSALSSESLIGSASGFETMVWDSDDKVVVQSPGQLVLAFTSGLQPESSWSTGFEGEYQIIDSSKICSSLTTFTAKAGNFSDGSVPADLYPGFVSCSWLISPGQGPIRLEFRRLDTERDQDIVSVYQGSTATNSNLLGNFSGSNLPSDLLMSEMSSMLVTFSSDARKSGLGFEITYSVACTASDGRFLFEGDSFETTLYGTSRPPFGQTCDTYSYEKLQVCSNGAMVDSMSLSSSYTASASSSNGAYESCEAAQCPEQSIHVAYEGVLYDNMLFVPGTDPPQYQSGLDCSWLVWPGGSVTSAVSGVRRSLPGDTHAQIALFVKRLDAVDPVAVYKAAPSSGVTLGSATNMPVRGDLVTGAMTQSSYSSVLVEGSPAVEIEFVTGSTVDPGTGWEIAYSAVASACSLKRREYESLAHRAARRRSDPTTPRLCRPALNPRPVG
eukprot:scaffold3443_cov33-Prasinocladus_malaysianus.AAC.2